MKHVNRREKREASRKSDQKRDRCGGREREERRWRECVWVRTKWMVAFGAVCSTNLWFVPPGLTPITNSCEFSALAVCNLSRSCPSPEPAQHATVSAPNDTINDDPNAETSRHSDSSCRKNIKTPRPRAGPYWTVAADNGGLARAGVGSTERDGEPTRDRGCASSGGPAQTRFWIPEHARSHPNARASGASNKRARSQLAEALT